jgi:superfamily I DNA and/or RNA helicase
MKTYLLYHQASYSVKVKLLRLVQCSAGTVDSFQAQERDSMAITLTRSNLQGEIGFLSDTHRMNVGMTSARRKFLCACKTCP